MRKGREGGPLTQPPSLTHCAPAHQQMKEAQDSAIALAEQQLEAIRGLTAALQGRGGHAGASTMRDYAVWALAAVGAAAVGAWAHSHSWR